jgi:hypothetical protein
MEGICDFHTDLAGMNLRFHISYLNFTVINDYTLCPHFDFPAFHVYCIHVLFKTSPLTPSMLYMGRSNDQVAL